MHLKTLSGRITVTWVSTSVECIWYKTIEKSIISHQHRGQWIKLYTKLQTTMATLAERAIFYSDWIIINGFVMEIKHTVSIIRYGFRSSLSLTTIGCCLRMQGNRHIENALITLIREITGFGLVRFGLNDSLEIENIVLLVVVLCCVWESIWCIKAMVLVVLLLRGAYAALLCYLLYPFNINLKRQLHH